MEKKDVDKIVNWIKDFFAKNKFAKGAILGMSGGKDSLIVAKLCSLALGSENVFGLIMPNGKMKDISDAIKTCELLGIRYEIADISSAYQNILQNTTNIYQKYNVNLTDVTTTNIAPRLRMTLLYSVAGSMNYLVANTSNLSEKMVGYTTKWGDNVGDFAPLVDLTKTEVCELGLLLGLPDELVNKVPDDGLSGLSDEQKLGFSYDELDNFIRNGKKDKNYDKIIQKHKNSSHKRNKISKFKYDIKNHFEI